MIPRTASSEFLARLTGGNNSGSAALPSSDERFASTAETFPLEVLSRNETENASLLSIADSCPVASDRSPPDDHASSEHLLTVETATESPETEANGTQQGESLPSQEGTVEQPWEEKRSVEQQHRSPVLLWRTWYLEIMSSLLALSCLLVIVIILSIYQGQPLPKWPKYLSINSLMAIFTAVFKASLIMPVAEGLGQLKWEWFNQPRRLADVVLFDDASRGPWGSLMLIVKQTFRLEHSYVASIGAIITIAALAIDPFSQAMVEYRPCPQILGHEVAETPRTNNYSAGVDYFGNNLAANIDPSMLGAIYKGLVDPEETESLLDVKCTTGNCTFGEMGHDEYFSSLGFCHSCRDITRQIERYENYTGFTLRSNVSSPRDLLPEYYRQRRKPEPKHPSVGSSTGLGAVLSASARADYPTLAVETLMLSCTNSSTCAANMEGRPLAFRCTLTPCVERYRAEVENGKYQEMKSKTPGQELKGCPIYADALRRQPAFALVTDSSLVNGVEQPCNPSAKWFPNSVKFSREHNALYEEQYSILGPKINETQWKYFPQECVWAVHQDSWGGIRTVLGDLLGGDLMNNVFAGDPSSSSTGPLWLKRMYSDGQGNISTVEDVFRGVANSMSAAIRNHPSGSHKDSALTIVLVFPTEMRWASGTVKVMQTCVYVEWSWIAYPAALLVLQAVFSAMVLAGSRTTKSRCGLGNSAWKSSPLALLFHGLAGDIRQENRDLLTVDQMNKAAQKVKVQLNRVDGVDDKGWRFCAT